MWGIVLVATVAPAVVAVLNLSCLKNVFLRSCRPMGYNCHFGGFHVGITSGVCDETGRLFSGLGTIVEDFKDLIGR